MCAGGGDQGAQGLRDLGLRLWPQKTKGCLQAEERRQQRCLHRRQQGTETRVWVRHRFPPADGARLQEEGPTGEVAAETLTRLRSRELRLGGAGTGAGTSWDGCSLVLSFP